MTLFESKEGANQWAQMYSKSVACPVYVYFDMLTHRPFVDTQFRKSQQAGGYWLNGEWVEEPENG